MAASEDLQALAWEWDLMDIIEKLEEIIDLTEDGNLPRSAGVWAENALDTALSIIDSIEERDDGGTGGQLQAIDNISDAADRWLD